MPRLMRVETDVRTSTSFSTQNQKKDFWFHYPTFFLRKESRLIATFLRCGMIGNAMAQTDRNTSPRLVKRVQGWCSLSKAGEAHQK